MQSGVSGVSGVIDYAGDVRILHEIGKGCQAEVFAGENVKTGEQYAVKTIMSHSVMEKDKSRIEFEIQSNYLLSHTLKSDYFPYFYGYWVQNNSIRLLFQRCESNAYTALRETNKYTQRYNFTLVLTYDMLNALGELQGKNIIHRDIKPENILLRNGHFKLGDLGLSRVESSHTLLTNDVGNQLSRSPQFYTGEYSCKTDIWSLAINIYYILQETLPFDQQTLSLLKIRHQFVNRIKCKHFSVSIQGKRALFLHQMLQSMLVIQPDKRSTASQILKDYFSMPTITDSKAVNRYLLLQYLHNRTAGVVGNFYLTGLLAIQDYHRFDDKLSGSPDGKRNICMLVKKEIYRMVMGLLGMARSAGLLDLIEILGRVLKGWEYELGRLLAAQQTVDVYKINKVEEKFPLILWCAKLIQEITAGQHCSAVYLWNIPIKLP